MLHSVSYRSMQVFATVSIDDNRQMKDLTRATVQDSAAMRLISFLTMIYLPASFVSVSVLLCNPCSESLVDLPSLLFSRSLG
jgi:hypothetical protein